MGQENGLENGQNGTSNGIYGKEKSGLEYIDYSGNDPFELFKLWQSEAKSSQLVNPDALCFSTASKEGVPSSRHLLLRRLDDNGFVIMTDARSRKCKELTENPHGTIAFLWSYRKDGHNVNRQVRIDGRVEELTQSSCQEIWDREPLFCKIRANICDQGQEIDWDEHKRNHDNLLDQITRTNQLPSMPPHVVFYKVIPTFIEFYAAKDQNIGDRLAFHCSDKLAKNWKVSRIAA